jgi:alpha-glucosidase
MKMNTKQKHWITLALLGLLGLLGLNLNAEALVIGVDFNRPKVSINMRGPIHGIGRRWNHLEIVPNEGKLTWSGLKDQHGTPTEVALEVVGDLKVYAHGRSEHPLFKDYIFGEIDSWKLSGLTPGVEYILYFYTLDLGNEIIIKSRGKEAMFRADALDIDKGLAVTADATGTVRGEVLGGVLAGIMIATPEEVAAAKNRVMKAQEVATIGSPDGSVQVDLRTDVLDEFQYRIRLKDSVLVEWSRLGMLLEGAEFQDALKVVPDGKPVTVRDRYRLVHGSASEVDETAREARFRITNRAGNELGVVFRVYNRGVAFRYEVPTGGPVEILNELSSFQFSSESVFYAAKYSAVGRFTPAYEELILNGPGTECFLPLVARAPQGAVLVTEAGMDGTSHGFHIVREGWGWKTELPLQAENPADQPRGAVVQAGWASPWRVLMVGAHEGDLIGNTLVTTLSAPSKVGNSEWIDPGISSWGWWSDSSSPKKVDELKKFIDLSADMKWAYSLVDANWDRKEVPGLVAYAESRGVKLFYWYNSGGEHNSVTEQPRDLMVDREVRRKEMAWLREQGIVGIKVDFFNSDKVERIRQYIDILEDAADYELMVNFHGCTLPRGWERTYPHMLTVEAVSGGEVYKFARGGWEKQAPSHNVNVVFSRGVVGPMDYTPGNFSRTVRGEAGTAAVTAAHELALGVLFTTGLQHWCDSYAVYQSQPEAVKALMSAIPADWDETRFVAGELNRYVVLARRKGAVWFVAGINGSDEPIPVEVPVNELAGPGAGVALFADDETGNAIVRKSGTSLVLPAHGGFVAMVESRMNQKKQP